MPPAPCIKHTDLLGVKRGDIVISNGEYGPPNIVYEVLGLAGDAVRLTSRVKYRVAEYLYWNEIKEIRHQDLMLSWTRHWKK